MRYGEELELSVERLRLKTGHSSGFLFSQSEADNSSLDTSGELYTLKPNFLIYPFFLRVSKPKVLSSTHTPEHCVSIAMDSKV